MESVGRRVCYYTGSMRKRGLVSNRRRMDVTAESSARLQILEEKRGRTSPWIRLVARHRMDVYRRRVDCEEFVMEVAEAKVDD